MLWNADSVAVAAFAAGAMENWGLMIYQAPHLLHNPDVVPTGLHAGSLLTIGHEVAHQVCALCSYMRM